MIQVSDSDFKTILRTLKAFTAIRPDSVKEHERWRKAHLLARKLKKQDKWNIL